MIGKVFRSTGSFYNVKGEDGRFYTCTLKGNIRLQDYKSTNPIAVGDNVEFDTDSSLIYNILERDNYIIRKSTKLSKQTHVIAANIDQCFLIVTLANPRTSLGFIDRFLVTAEAYRIPVILTFNKIDQYDEKQHQYCDEIIKIYKNIGYECIKISAKQLLGINILTTLMQGKVSLFSGHSGVGKSTLINIIKPELKLKTLEVSRVHQKGMHATTFAEMFEIKTDTYIIDTPGIKEFGIIDFEKSELCHYFPEMFMLLKDCTFYNCTHTHEPGCAVIKAVEKSIISKERYQSYLSIYEDLEK